MAFIALLSVVLGSVHLYLWRRLVHDTRVAGGARRLASLVLGALAVSVPATFLIWLQLPRDVATTFATGAFSWLGFMFYLVIALVLWDGVRLLRWLRDKVRRGHPDRGLANAVAAPLSPTQSRRVFVARSAAVCASLAASGVSALGLRSALYEITTPEIPVGLGRFPRALDGYQIALLSDIHIGPSLNGRFLRSVVDQTNGLRPDLVAIVGDLVDGSVAHIGSQVAELTRLRARHGVYFVTGNHEYYSGADEWVAFLSRIGIRVLTNERLSIGDAGAQFDLAGVPDLYANRTGGTSPDAALATKGRDDQRELVMLAHQPLQIARSAAVGTGLQLSGHTHGGQLFPFGALTALAQPYLAGLHRHGATHTQIYVSRGTGFWGPPMRVLAPAEISRLRLHSV